MMDGATSMEIVVPWEMRCKISQGGGRNKIKNKDIYRWRSVWRYIYTARVICVICIFTQSETTQFLCHIMSTNLTSEIEFIRRSSSCRTRLPAALQRSTERLAATRRCARKKTRSFKRKQLSQCQPCLKGEFWLWRSTCNRYRGWDLCPEC